MSEQQAYLKLIVISALALVLAACSSNQSDLRAWIDEVKQRPGQEIEPLPTPSRPDRFEYAANDLRDPFSGGPPEAGLEDGPDDSEGELVNPPDFDRRREYLEGFELDSLDMVGTLYIGDELFALVRDPDGVLHRVRPGNYMGRNHGYVISVRDDRIVLTEKIQDGPRTWVDKEASLILDEE